MEYIVIRIYQKDLRFLPELIKEDNVKSIIDMPYHFIVTAEALRYLEEVNDRGKVVITL